MTPSPAVDLTASARKRCEIALGLAAAAPGMFWTLDADQARADARAIDARGALRPPAGLPVAVKDNYDVAGLPTRLGLAQAVHVATADADAVARLREAGCIVIGKTAMDQLAWSMTGQAPGYPLLENPAAPGHIAGGSSGGSAAAVAAGIVALALATDSAGSARVPAAWCGVCAVKPTHGRVSLRGVAPVAPSLDTAGVIARGVRECALGLTALGLGDPSEFRGEIPCAVLADDVPAWFAEVCELLQHHGSFAPVTRLRALPEARIGRILASELAGCWADVRDPSPEVQAGLQRGRGLDPAAVTEDRARLVAAERQARALFAGGPCVLLLPTVAAPAPTIGDGGSVADATRFTRTLSAFGWPCASVPCGKVDGRPVGLQLAAAPGDDERLLGCAQRAADVLDPEYDLA